MTHAAPGVSEARPTASHFVIAATPLVPTYHHLLVCTCRYSQSPLSIKKTIHHVGSSILCRRIQVRQLHEPSGRRVFRCAFTPSDGLNSCAGPKTVFFWAPVMKWCLVAAGLKDLGRPAEKLSVSQNVGAYLPRFVGSFAPEKAIFVFQLWPQLASSGCATRSLSHRSTIPSKPYALSPVLSYGQLNRTDPMQVNFFVGSSGLAQLVRIAKYVQPTIFPYCTFSCTSQLSLREPGQCGHQADSGVKPLSCFLIVYTSL